MSAFTTSAVNGSLLNSVSTKIGLLLLTGLSGHLSFSPPNAAVPSTQCLQNKTLFERCIRWVTFCSKMMIWAATLCDVLVTSLEYYKIRAMTSPPSSQTTSTSPTRFPSRYTPNTSSAEDWNTIPIPFTNPLFSPSPLLILGAIAVFLGAILRLWCYRTLGRFFTFELSIRPSHNLVTTGPYAYVRHPSYTGVYLTLIGATAVGFAPGALLRERWWNPIFSSPVLGCVASTATTSPSPATSTAILTDAQCQIAPLVAVTITSSYILRSLVFLPIAFWFIKVWYALKGTNKRLGTEDRELRKVFGESWDTYAKRVPWKLLPGVF